MRCTTCTQRIHQKSLRLLLWGPTLLHMLRGLGARRVATPAPCRTPSKDTKKMRTMWMAASKPAVLAAAPNRVSSPITVWPGSADTAAQPC